MWVVFSPTFCFVLCCDWLLSCLWPKPHAPLTPGPSRANHAVIRYSNTLTLIFFQSITQYNGSAVVAMVGKECVAIASDLRFGVQAQTISWDFEKVFQLGPKLFAGLPGLVTDVLTVYV